MRVSVKADIRNPLRYSVKIRVFYVHFVKVRLTQSSNIYSEMKAKLLDKTDGNEYIIEYSQSVRMDVPGGSQESVCGFYKTAA